MLPMQYYKGQSTMVRTQHYAGTHESKHISHYRDSLTHTETNFRPQKVWSLAIGLEALLGTWLAVEPTGQ